MIQFTLAHQRPDGDWYYRLYANNRPKRQTDFHQGFIVSSLLKYRSFSGDADPLVLEAALRGASFYRRCQFAASGRSYWRLPRRWPTDIHCQAQGILTFLNLGRYDAAYHRFARRVAWWTLRYMRDQRGYFYYRRGRWWTNRIAYMRWGQAWMLLALVGLYRDGALAGTDGVIL
jgi:hypothetical protein